MTGGIFNCFCVYIKAYIKFVCMKWGVYNAYICWRDENRYSHQKLFFNGFFFDGFYVLGLAMVGWLFALEMFFVNGALYWSCEIWSRGGRDMRMKRWSQWCKWLNRYKRGPQAWPRQARLCSWTPQLWRNCVKHRFWGKVGLVFFSATVFYIFYFTWKKHNSSNVYINAHVMNLM